MTGNVDEPSRFMMKWTFPLSDLTDLDTGKKKYLESSRFRTVHTKMGITWSLRASIQEDPNLPVSEIKQENAKKQVCICGCFEYEGVRDNVGARSQTFFQVGNKRVGTCIVEEDQEWTSEEHEVLIRKDSLDAYLSLFSHDSQVNFVWLLHIPESQFDLEQIFAQMETLRKFQRQAPQPILLSAFKGVSVTELCPQPPAKRPKTDTLNALDLQILTKDDRVIWCHRLVLGSQNKEFAKIISSLAVKGESAVQVKKYGSDTMMEILRYVYTEEFSDKFDGLSLREILGAAHEFRLLEMRSGYLRKLINGLSVENCAKMLSLAKSCHLWILHNLSLTLATGNLSAVWGSAGEQDPKSEIWTKIMEAADAERRTLKIPPGLSFQEEEK